jgi:phosphoribosylformimino-5-aminoimidazole carboxamide ribotide isomerase
VIASGGIATLDDIRRVAAIGCTGCIVGRALYDDAFTLPDALAAAGEA